MRLLHVGTRGCEQARELSLSGSLFLYRSLHAIIYHNHVWLDILLKLNCSHILWLQGHWVLAALFKVFINAFICSLTSADLFSPFFPLTSSRSFYKQIYLELELWQVCRLGRVILFKLLCRYQAWDHFFLPSWNCLCLKYMISDWGNHAGHLKLRWWNVRNNVMVKPSQRDVCKG